MREFDFAEPSSVAEASQMLADQGDDARIIAGGSALMLAMRQRMLAPTHLISVARLPRLHGIDFDPRQGLRIGAMSRHIDVARSELVKAHAPVLARMAAQVANPQVRNQGTIGGNLCYADPSTDPPGCLMALDASVVLGSTRGERVLSMEEFLVDYYTTAMQSDELLLEIRVPLQAPGTQGNTRAFCARQQNTGPWSAWPWSCKEKGRYAIRHVWSWAHPRPFPPGCAAPRIACVARP